MKERNIQRLKVKYHFTFLYRSLSNHFTLINAIRGTVYDYFKGVEKKANCLDLSKAFYLGNHIDYTP